METGEINKEMGWEGRDVSDSGADVGEQDTVDDSVKLEKLKSLLPVIVERPVVRSTRRYRTLKATCQLSVQR